MPNVFQLVRENVRLKDAVTFLNLTLTRREGDGNQWRFWCPRCKGSDRRALSINVAEDKFTCFAHKPFARGTDATALVAHVQDCSQTDAAKMLVDHFNLGQKKQPRTRERTKESASVTHPILDILGLSPEDGEALGAAYDAESERFVLPLKVGTLAIATREDQAPLLLFSLTAAEPTQAEDKPSPDTLRKLFRVV